MAVTEKELSRPVRVRQLDLGSNAVVLSGTYISESLSLAGAGSVKVLAVESAAAAHTFSVSLETYEAQSGQWVSVAEASVSGTAHGFLSADVLTSLVRVKVVNGDAVNGHTYSVTVRVLP